MSTNIKQPDVGFEVNDIRRLYQDLTQQQMETIKSHAQRLAAEKKHAEEIRQEEEAFKKAQRQLDFQSFTGLSDKMSSSIVDAFDKAKDKLAAGAAQAANNITRSVDTKLDTYVKSIEELSAHLVGTQKTYADISNTLTSALSANYLVRQEEVYNNLNNLVKSGIVQNVEQKAFLQTLSDDMSLNTKATTDYLNRLFRLQQSDTLANRLSLEYTLMGFLNSTYENSQYIKDAMGSVTSALIQSESLMSANEALSYESTIQSILGSYYSAGVSQNTVSGLAAAINSLSSGDISNIGSGLSNLLLMGAARRGEDYGALLTNNLTGTGVQSILSGMSSYLGEMVALNGSNNVVMSQLAKTFGIDISDLIALANVNTTASAEIDTTPGAFLGDAGSFIPFAQQFGNVMDNFLFSLATGIGETGFGYGAYKIAQLASNNIAPILTATGDAFDSKLMKGIGVLTQYAPLLTLIPAAFEAANGAFKNFGQGASEIYNILGSPNKFGGTVVTSGQGVSGSMVYSASTSDSLLSQLSTSLSQAGLGGISPEAEEQEDTTVHDIKDDTLNIYNTLGDMRDLLGDIREKLDYSIGR